MANTTMNTVTINGKVYEGKVDLVMDLIKVGFLTEVSEKKSAPKTATKKDADKPKTEFVPWTDEQKADYHDIAEKLGVMGKNGVWNWAKAEVRNCMGLKGKKREQAIAKAQKNLIAMAQKDKKLEYYLKNLGLVEDKKAQ